MVIAMMMSVTLLLLQKLAEPEVSIIITGGYFTPLYRGIFSQPITFTLAFQRSFFPKKESF